MQPNVEIRVATAEDAMWGLSIGRPEFAAGVLDYARFVGELVR